MLFSKDVFSLLCTENFIFSKHILILIKRETRFFKSLHKIEKSDAIFWMNMILFKKKKRILMGNLGIKY